jgi:hypothetical protein
MTGTYSKLFQKPSYSPPPKSDPIPAPQLQAAETTSPDRTEIRSEKRTVQLPIKRKTKRYSFEFYDDQIFKLKQLKRDAEDEGELLTLSDMAREALDLYLKSKNVR